MVTKAKSSATVEVVTPAKVNMIIRIISALGLLARTFAGIFLRR